MSLLRWLFDRRKRQTSTDRGPKIVALEDREPMHLFETSLAGVDLVNPDGSIRQEIIARTEAGAETVLMVERGAMGLVSVYLAQTGEQLGFLPRDLSQRIKREARHYDFRTFVRSVGEPNAESGIREPVLAVEVFEKA